MYFWIVYFFSSCFASEDPCVPPPISNPIGPEIIYNCKEQKMMKTEVRTCDEWCEANLCCECFNAYKGKRAVPNFRDPGVLAGGKVGVKQGSDECMCGGMYSEPGGGVCYDPEGAGNLRPSMETNIRNFFNTCCMYEGTPRSSAADLKAENDGMLAGKEEQKAKADAKKAAADKLQKEEQQRIQAKNAELDARNAKIAALQKPGAKIPCDLLRDEVSCSDPLVYNVNSAQNTAIRGKNAQGTQTSFNSICCVQPTCGVLHALDSNKYNCGKIDPRLTRDFEYNARTMSSRSTTKGRWEFDCCTCAGECKTCREWSANPTKMTCKGSNPNAAMEDRSMLRCPASTFQTICCQTYKPGVNPKDAPIRFETCFGELLDSRDPSWGTDRGIATMQRPLRSEAEISGTSSLVDFKANIDMSEGIMSKAESRKYPSGIYSFDVGDDDAVEVRSIESVSSPTDLHLMLLSATFFVLGIYLCISRRSKSSNQIPLLASISDEEI